MNHSLLQRDIFASEEAGLTALQPGPTQPLTTKMSLDVTVGKEIDANTAKTHLKDLADTHNSQVSSCRGHSGATSRQT